jgi:hypothetical protein
MFSADLWKLEKFPIVMAKWRFVKAGDKTGKQLRIICGW